MTHVAIRCYVPMLSDVIAEESILDVWDELFLQSYHEDLD